MGGADGLCQTNSCEGSGTGLHQYREGTIGECVCECVCVCVCVCACACACARARVRVRVRVRVCVLGLKGADDVCGWVRVRGWMYG